MGMLGLRPMHFAEVGGVKREQGADEGFSAPGDPLAQDASLAAEGHAQDLGMLGARYLLEALVARGACAGNDVNVCILDAQPDENSGYEVKLNMAHHAHMLAGRSLCADRFWQVWTPSTSVELRRARGGSRSIRPLHAGTAQPQPWQSQSWAGRRGAPSASGMSRVITMICGVMFRPCAWMRLSISRSSARTMSRM